MDPVPCVIGVDASNFDSFPCCGIKCGTHPGRIRKKAWLQANAKFGLRAKVLLAPDGKPGGYIEYIPGEHAWRGVDARGYMFLHCVWVHARRYQSKGWGGLMVEDFVNEARAAGMRGAAAIVRDGPWMADQRLFISRGFEPVDSAPPDFHLMVRKFDRDAANPAFQKDWDRKAARYGAGLTIIRSAQCPHIAKFADEIAETAAEEYGIEPTVVELKSWRDAQKAPTPYAVFAILYNGKVIADHQISRTRFRNIMRREVV